MDEVEVEAVGNGRYTVSVTSGGTTTRHVVTVDPDRAAAAAPGVDGPVLVAATFRFLLDREPKESILGEFDLAVVERYFPEFPERIGTYLS